MTILIPGWLGIATGILALAAGLVLGYQYGRRRTIDAVSSEVGDLLAGEEARRRAQKSRRVFGRRQSIGPRKVV